MREFGGIIFFYATIIIMILAVNHRFEKLNEIKENTLAYVELKEH